MGAERLDRIRRLQEDFDAFSHPYRLRLLEARAARPSHDAAELELAVEDYVAACTVYVSTHRSRFEDAGFAVEPLIALISEWPQSLSSPSNGTPRAQEPDPVAGTFIVPDPLPAGVNAFGDGIVYSDSALQILFQPDRPGLALAGQVDARNVDAFAHTLATRVDGAAEFHVDLRGLEFCDLGGLGAIVRTASRLDSGHSLVVHSIPNHLRLALELVGWGPETVSGLVLAEEGA